MLNGKVVVVTGAGSGVGRASARLFAAHGAKVVCGDVNEGWVKETVDLVDADGGSALGLTCDVADEAAVAALVARACEVHGRLDVMFNNAGISHRGTLMEDTDNAQWRRLLDVNLMGVVFGCRHAVRTFKRQGGGGVIVNTGSAAGVVGWGGVAYGVSKAAVIQLTKALAIEAAPFGIRVNCTLPGGIDTNFGRPPADAFAPRDPEQRAVLDALHPLGRMCTADDVAAASLFLASDLSSNITGVALPIDGGYLAR